MRAKVQLEGCESGRIGRSRKPLCRKAPWVRIPLPPQFRGGFRLRPSRACRRPSLKNPSHSVPQIRFCHGRNDPRATVRVWELRVRLGRAALTGKHRQISRTFRRYRAPGIQGASQADDRLARGQLRRRQQDGQGSSRPVDRAPGGPGRTPKTIDGYRSIARARLEPALGPVKLRQLTAYQLDDLYLLSLIPASPPSMWNFHAALSAALRQAVKWDWIDRSPAERATPPGAAPPEVGPPDADDISRLITAVESVDPDMASMLFVAATTGCRRGELRGLRWSDLDTDNATLTVRRSISDTSRGVEVKDPKTHRARRISLD